MWYWLGLLGLGLLSLVGFFFWRQVRINVAKEIAHDINQKTDEHATHYRKQADAIRAEDITDPNDYL